MQELIEEIRATPRRINIDWTMEVNPIQPEAVDFIMFEFQQEVIQSLGIPLRTFTSTPFRSERVNWLKEGF